MCVPALGKAVGTRHAAFKSQGEGSQQRDGPSPNYSVGVYVGTTFLKDNFEKACKFIYVGASDFTLSQSITA